jgi:hypothetical protein
MLLSMTLYYWVEYVSGITDATMKLVSRRFLSNQSHCSMSSVFFLHTNSCLSFPIWISTVFLRFLSFAACARVFLHRFCLFLAHHHEIRSQWYSKQREKEKQGRERRTETCNVCTITTVYFFSFFLFSFSTSLFYYYQYHDDLRSYHHTTFVHTQHDLNQFISIYYLSTYLYLNIYRHSHLTSQKKKKSLDILNQYWVLSMIISLIK